MIEIINNVARDKEVSSTGTREFQDSVRYALTSLYHKSLSLTSEMNAISSMVQLTEKSSVPLLREYINTITNGTSGLIITAGTTRTDPSALTDTERAESHTEFGCINSKRLESVSVFTDDSGNMKGHIKVVRSTLNGIVDEMPDSIVENTAAHIFDSKIPYIINFKKENLERASIYLDIKTDSVLLKLNAIRYIPYPGIGSIILDGLWRDAATKVMGPGSSTMTVPDSSVTPGDIPYDAYTMPAYIHTEVINTADFRVGFSSKRYITEMGGIVIGIGSLIGELNVYAPSSYAGYTVTVPSGKKLDSLSIVPGLHYQTTANMAIRIYDDINNFNNMNDQYVKRCTGTSTGIGISPDGNNRLYLLVELNSVSNISPTISKILVGYN